MRRIRFSKNDPIVEALRKNNVYVEDDKYSDYTVVASFPVEEPLFEKGKADVSMWEQLENVAQYQFYWADNSVSATVTFSESEAADIPRALELYESRLKAVSFLPITNHNYAQAPYEEVSREKLSHYKSFDCGLSDDVKSMVPTPTFCDNDSCLV